MAQPKRTATPPLKGEGEPMEANVTTIELGENRKKETFNADLVGATAPSRKFVADGFSLIKNPAFVRILFVQTKIDGISPRALLDIHVPVHSVKQFINGALKRLPDTIPNMPEPFQLTGEPEQTVALEANFFRASVSPGASCIDCYYASPFSLQAMKSHSALHVEGVVRVQLPDAVFVSFIKNLKTLDLGNGSGGGNDLV